MFKAGDKVVCVDAYDIPILTEGGEYTVEGMIESGGDTFVVIKGVSEESPYEMRGWHPERFQLVG